MKFWKYYLHDDIFFLRKISSIPENRSLGLFFEQFVENLVAYLSPGEEKSFKCFYLYLLKSKTKVEKLELRVYYTYYLRNLQNKWNFDLVALKIKTLTW